MSDSKDGSIGPLRRTDPLRHLTDLFYDVLALLHSLPYLLGLDLDQ